MPKIEFTNNAKKHSIVQLFMYKSIASWTKNVEWGRNVGLNNTEILVDELLALDNPDIDSVKEIISKYGSLEYLSEITITDILEDILSPF